MKTSNFPDKKNKRQLGALERLKRRPRVSKSGEPHASYIVEMEALLNRTSNSKRDVRTKKNRSNRAKKVGYAKI